MIEFFKNLFSAGNFMPHGMCYLWNPPVLWLNVLSDSLIAAAYYAIPFFLFSLAKRRRDIEFKGIFVAFGVFILACGTTHVMGALTVWNPVYRLDGVIKAITAAASITTVVMLAAAIPALVKLPSPSQLAKVNHELENEVSTRRSAEAAVRTLNAELEDRVNRRTAELANAVHELRTEIDRRKLVEDQLIQAQKMEGIGRLAGGVAHDFNNLLTVILGFNEMLRNEVAPGSEAAEYVDEILRAAQRASGLTNQLLAFSRRQVTTPRVLDLNQLVQNVEKMLRRIIGEDIELQLRLAPEVDRVKADPSQIDQVIMNLAVNSRDAMPDGGKLILETANVDITGHYAGTHINLQPGPYVMLAVTDTGTGMDAATRARIFEPFFTTKEKGKGTGLGLSIVYGVVKQNGGEILVYSEPGHGTVFKIYLPAAAATTDAPVVQAAPVDEQQPTETVLVVEDEDQVRSLTRTILARRGYRILEAPSAARALELARRHEGAIDLLLTDIVMPQMNGVDLAKEMELVRPGIRVLFMSGYTENGVVTEAALRAEKGFIQKPFNSAHLLKKVRETLGAS